MFILSINSVFGQAICKLSDVDSKIETCLNGANNATDIINANNLVKDILDKLNLTRINFVVKICPSINNCLATIYDNQNYILVDINWLYSIKKEKNDWFLLQVLSHEMGHHLLNHTLKNADNLSQSRLQELEADEFSGYVLGLYGASLFDIKTALGNVPKNDNNNSTHPINQLREKAVINGYNSSMNNSQNYLLNKITCNTDFSLNNYQNIIFEARNSFD